MLKYATRLDLALIYHYFGNFSRSEMIYYCSFRRMNLCLNNTWAYKILASVTASGHKISSYKSRKKLYDIIWRTVQLQHIFISENIYFILLSIKLGR